MTLRRGDEVLARTEATGTKHDPLFVGWLVKAKHARCKVVQRAVRQALIRGCDGVGLASAP